MWALEFGVEKSGLVGIGKLSFEGKSKLMGETGPYERNCGL